MLRNFILTFFISLILVSCAQKETKKKFKLILGKNAVLVVEGGAYVETIDLATNVDTIIPLDANNSEEIPFGTYKMFFVAFEGPTANAGRSYCSSIDSITLSAATATVNVYLDEVTCSNSDYTKIFSSLPVPTGDLWGTALFGTGKWSP